MSIPMILPSLSTGFDDTPSRGFSTSEVSRIARVSYRQLDYWDRSRLLSPSVRGAQGSGTQRVYSFEDLILAVVINRMLDTGISLQKLRKTVRYLQEWPGIDLLVSDGRRVYAPASDSLEELRAKVQGRGFFVLSIASIREELRLKLGRRAV